MLCLKQQMSEEPTEEDLQEEEFIESSSNNTLNRNMWKTDLLEGLLTKYYNTKSNNLEMDDSMV
jgi:hypothetical protein